MRFLSRLCALKNLETGVNLVLLNLNEERDFMRNSVLLIPALNPEENFITYVQSLMSCGFERIIIVNDGSSDNKRHIFDALERLSQNGKRVDVLVHAVNLGKGRALKYGFNFYMVHMNDFYANSSGLITVDSDGQHTADDVSRMDEALGGQRRTIVLGCRDFSQADVPWKSRFGNQCTCGIFRLLFGKKITDTQTGLRAFSADVLPEIISLFGERFEYETNALIACIRKGIAIKQISIQTIYEDQNRKTHFHPLRDSLQIYAVIFSVFFRYSLASMSSFALDFCLFWALYRSLPLEPATRIWTSTALARLVSSIYNYLINKNFVFRLNGLSRKNTIAPYMLLCVAAMCVSSLGVTFFHQTLHIPATVAKCIIDPLIFCCNYLIQQNLIFANKGG